MSESVMKTLTPAPSLYSLAKEACEKHNDIERATQLVVNRINAQPALRDSLITDIVRSAVREAVYDVRHNEKSELKWRPCTRGLGVVAAVSHVQVRVLLDSWRMPDGRTLGDWTGEELLPLSESERELAKGHKRNADFYAAIASQTPSDKRVRDAMDNAKVENLWSKVMGT